MNHWAAQLGLANATAISQAFVLALSLTSGLIFSGDTSGQSEAATESHQHHHMTVGTSGVVMNENRDTLPRDCPQISRDHEFTIHAGREYASGEPGIIFGMSQHEARVEPCSRVLVRFVNDDSVRHQWMVHGLPKYLYPAGMFHLEAAGGTEVSGVFIVPGGDHTYLIHCDLAQHMEKGMRGQLVVGRGSGNLWGIPAISDSFFRSTYLPANISLWVVGALILGFILVTLLLTWKSPHVKRRGNHL